jgi:hypothetical protein
MPLRLVRLGLPVAQKLDPTHDNFDRAFKLHCQRDVIGLPSFRQALTDEIILAFYPPRPANDFEIEPGGVD